MFAEIDGRDISARLPPEYTLVMVGVPAAAAKAFDIDPAAPSAVTQPVAVYAVEGGSALAAAAPASDQFTFPPPGAQPLPVQQIQVWDNVARINLGVGFYNASWYSCYYSWTWGWTSCSSSSYTSYIPIVFGPQVDLNVGA